MKSYFIVIIIGYIFGCLQWSYILSKTFLKVDIRTLGGGNAGASNTVISLGWKWGIVVALLDILKGIISILIIKYLFEISYLEENIFLLYLNGISVILGHDFPFFMGFRGGKGAASLLGMTIGLDYRLGILGFLVIALVTIFTDYIALGTLALNIFLVLSAIYLGYGHGSIILALLIAAVAVYLHIPNIKSIVNKEEKGLREALKKKVKNT
ncbi:glycerol-3-phosphate acyltransferase [Tissierella sp.]|uniref:glycerol-3-phosphate acyltransferase n=1 Tax=Tissierella sp. TaxID=41274 RepID=UPI002862FB61|nr:glycerol-3-phosphate acyltransferase [Tissierella sp.]MDR7855363.1 glycerol-3-phosphate acyltransferase [Tissierella sp.]